MQRLLLEANHHEKNTNEEIMTTKTIDIDPTNLTPETMIYLDALFPGNASELDGVRFDEGKPYPVEYGGETCMVTLSRDVIGWRVETYDSKRAWRFGVYRESTSPVVGAGGNGVVRRLAGTLVKMGDAQFDYRTHNPRVVKEQSNATLKDVEDVKNEAAISREHPELHVKAEFMMGEFPARDSYMVMAEIAGEELFEIINRDMNETQVLTEAERFMLTINMLYAFKRTNAREVIHRDLKPENILVDMRTCATQYIDFGLARYKNKPDQRSCGTPTTAAPEMMVSGETRADHRADIYSLGLIAIILWKGGFRSGRKALHESIANGDDRYLPTMKDFRDISYKDKSSIKHILAKMISFEPVDRATIDEAISVFEEVYLNYRLSKLHYDKDSAEIKKSLRKSYHQGLLFGQRLHDIRFSPSADAFHDLLHALDASLQDVVDEYDHVKMFAEASRVALFQNAKSLQEIRDRAQSVVNGMFDYLSMFAAEDEYINQQIAQLEKNGKSNEANALIAEAKQCSAQLRYMHHKATKKTREVTFDDIAEVHAKFTYFSENIKDRLERLNESLFKLTANRYLHEVGLFATTAQPQTAKVDPVEMMRALNNL